MRSWLIAVLVVAAGCGASSTKTDTPATTMTTASATTTTKPFRCPDGSKPVPLPPPTDEKFAYECHSVTSDGPPVSYKP